LAERFELYVCGLELANAFGELTDATHAAPALRAGPGEKARPLRLRVSHRRDFLAALAHGLPESAGIALDSTGW